MTDILGVELCFLDPSSLDRAVEVGARDEGEFLFWVGLILIFFNFPDSSPPSGFRLRDVLEVEAGVITESKPSVFTSVLGFTCLPALVVVGFLLSDMGVGGVE